MMERIRNLSRKRRKSVSLFTIEYLYSDCKMDGIYEHQIRRVQNNKHVSKKAGGEAMRRGKGEGNNVFYLNAWVSILVSILVSISCHSD